MRKSFISFTLSNMLGLSLSMLSSLWAAKILGPTAMGLYNSLNLLIVYSPILTLGILNGLNREIPYYIGRGDVDNVSTIANTTHYLTRVISLSSFLLLAPIGIFLLLYRGSTQAGFGVLTFAVLLPVTFYKTFVEVTYRTNNDFQKLAIVRIATGILGVVSILLLFVVPWEGMMLRTILVALIGLVLLWWKRGIVSVPVWDFQHFKRLFSIGMPIFAVGYMYVFMTNLDRTFIAKYLGVEALGYYTPSLLFLQGMAVLPMSVNQIIYPKMAEIYGQTNSLRSLASLAFKPIPVLACIQAPFLMVVWIYLPFLLEKFLPQYQPGLQACRLTLIAGFLLSLSSPAIIFNIVKRQGVYAAIIAASSVAMLISSQILTSHGLGLVGVAWSVIIGNFIFITASAGVAWLLIAREKIIICNQP